MCACGSSEIFYLQSDGQEEADKNEEGLYPRWSGRNLFNERQSMDASTWALIYQQQDISDDAIFDPVCVKGSIDGMRKAGRLQPGSPGHPRDLNKNIVKIFESYFKKLS